MKEPLAFRHFKSTDVAKRLVMPAKPESSMLQVLDSGVFSTKQALDPETRPADHLTVHPKH